MQGQQTQHPAFQHVVNSNRGAISRHPMRGAPKPAYPQRPVFDPGYRNVNKRKATRREELPYGRRQGLCAVPCHFWLTPPPHIVVLCAQHYACAAEDPDFRTIANKPTNLSKELQFFEKVSPC